MCNLSSQDFAQFTLGSMLRTTKIKSSTTALFIFIDVSSIRIGQAFGAVFAYALTTSSRSFEGATLRPNGMCCGLGFKSLLCVANRDVIYK